LLHPETKNVYIFLSNNNCFSNESNGFSQFEDTKNLNIKDYIVLLTSINTLKDSFMSIKNGKPFSLKMYNEDKFFILDDFNLDEVKKFKLRYYPYFNQQFAKDKNELDALYSNNEKYLKKITKLLKEKNINYIFIVPPSHALYTALFFKSRDVYSYRALEKQKRLAVSLSDNDVYDFSIINQYTSADILNNDNYYWENLTHGTFLLGLKIFKILRNPSLQEMPGFEYNLYVKLNKKNINIQLKNQREQVKDYIINNKKFISQFEDYNRKNSAALFLYKDTYFKEVPADIQKELNWLESEYKKINSKIINNDKIERGMFFKNI